jgi:eukaryotic-like serine/threonine-protein kinase
VKQNDAVLHDVAGAMVDGIPVDWASAESISDDESMRRVVRELKVIAAIADVHGTLSLSSDHRAIDSEAINLDSAQRRSAADVESLSETLQTWGALRVLEKVGEGAFGAVYRAWDMRLDREVALKLLRRQESAHSREASAVIDEGRMLAQVRHPNVVTVHGADRSAGRVGLWMEFIQGQTLEHLLRERGPFGAGEATLIGLDVCRALSAVHRAGLLHRDIKAHNVMREHGGRIVLMDFGTGVEAADPADSADGLAGTPLYLAPEVLDGQEARVASDIYSVGVLLYHLVTGSYPVYGNDVQEIRARHSHEKRIFLRDARPDLPDEFVQIVERALSPEPDGRYQSAGAFEAALASVKEAVQRAAATASESLVTQSVQPTVPLPSMRRTSRWTRWLAVAAALVVLGGAGSVWLIVSKAQLPVIAVLPFKNLSAEADSDYFVDGLTDEVIRNLSVIDGLSVRSSTSSFAFKNKPRNTREVGKQLNANLVLEASVLRVGTQLRINVQLVRAADDVPLWSERYDRELKDVFAIQDEISRSIVNELRLKLGRGQRRYDTNVDAYDLYLKGRTFLGRRGTPSLEQAAELFEQALAKDSTFAPAHAGLANAYALMLAPTSSTLQFETAQAILRPAALKARELDPLLADAHMAMGWLCAHERDWGNAEKAFQRAIELDPSLTQAYTSYSISTLQPLGKLDEALRLLGTASRSDPLSLEVEREIGEVRFLAGRYGEAIDTFQRVIAVEPDFPFVKSDLGRALMFAGRLPEGTSVIESLHGRNLGRFKPSKARRSPWLAYAYVQIGRREDAETLAAEHEDSPAGLAVIYAALGDKDRSFEALERTAVVEPHHLGRLLMYPELAPLRGDPRFTALRASFGLPPQ